MNYMIEREKTIVIIEDVSSVYVSNESITFYDEEGKYLGYFALSDVQSFYTYSSVDPEFHSKSLVFA
ncbi:hypothetical protein [Paraliobacillus sp. X-1268]|uniref:hypothetical protein n=1 Tax=Paraliobacillus sp. X-1268 TaxID=2213193 RepID=UPI000E3C5F1F|nr:hypothetical protein [Paraliobacillus sp. X-1268]